MSAILGDFIVFYQGLPQLARHNEEDHGDEVANFPLVQPSVNRHFGIGTITSFHLYAVSDWLRARLQTSSTRTIAIYLHSQIQNVYKICNVNLQEYIFRISQHFATKLFKFYKF